MLYLRTLLFVTMLFCGSWGLPVTDPVTDETSTETTITTESTDITTFSNAPAPQVKVSVSVSTSFSDSRNPVAQLSPLIVSSAATRSDLSVEEPTSEIRNFGARTYRYRPRPSSSRRPYFSQAASEQVAVRLAPRFSKYKPPTFYPSDDLPKQPDSRFIQPEPRSINYNIPTQSFQHRFYQSNEDKPSSKMQHLTPPLQNYELPESVHIATNGRAHGLASNYNINTRNEEPSTVPPVQNYEIPVSVHVATNGRAHGLSANYNDNARHIEKQTTIQPVQNYEIPESIHLATNGRAHGLASSYNLKNTNEQSTVPPVQNYEIPESVHVATNGRAHGLASKFEINHPDSTTEGLKVFDKALNAAPVAASQKFGYVVEERNYRKYRVEEKTADGFIVGEYGVVSNDDGELRGVRYTADSNINPKLIYDALMKFLAL